ncbi:D-alanyl-D-alanine carboxypeptidase/D-alanyl-D-alanine-endopeptidase [Pseudonocardia benzenivorans]|uniref:D-alanyl-D-alanine carboxypeptidase/D-alanyl-D-alanine-endopeptidase n=1 Tax=Pseudonocardia benzenivorans TaxID=228005 RepID=A0ABW3VKK9_9PSEU
MGFGRRIGDTFRVPGRGLRRGVAVLTVLVTAAAIGSAVALSAPQLLGSSAADAPAIPVPVPALGPLPADAPLPTAAGLTAALQPVTGTSALGTFGGAVLDPSTGSQLWQRAVDQPLAPGSTAKLLTSAAALLTLAGTDHLYTKVVQGPTPGSVVIVGGGDPSLTDLPPGKDSVYPDAPRLADLAAAVEKSMGNQKITSVIVDTSRYTGPTFAQGWDRADIAGGDITPIEPLMLDGGRIDPTAQDGARVADPAGAAGQAFAKELGLDPSVVSSGTAPPNAQVLGTVSSASISDLIEYMLEASDNVTAEILAREVAIARGGEPSFTGGAAQVLAALSQARIDPSGAVLVDGSGLSTVDRIPPRLLTGILAAAAAPPQGPDDTDFLRPILTGLPVAGGDGTLEDRFGTGTSAAGRGVVRAKTGTLTGVSSLAGVVTDADGRLLVFAFMSNGPSPADVRPRLDAIAAELSRCGCR